MPRSIHNHTTLNVALLARGVFLLLAACLTACQGASQETPLLSGGVGFLTSTNGGSTSYTPIISPLLAAPIGHHVLIEGRAGILEVFSPNGNGQPGYAHMHFIHSNYLQGDYIASRHLTVIGGNFLVPFNTYSERLSPIWIGNLQDGPLIAGMSPAASLGLGGELRGSAISRRKYSVDYATYFSSRSSNEQFPATRASGGRVGLYLPDQRLEMGFSYSRLLQGKHENFYGVHVWWEPQDSALRFRSEYTHGQHAQGYWVEADYRPQFLGGLDSFAGRFEPVFRMQQTFRIDNLAGDGVPSVNTQRVDFGLNYNLPHNTRILTSYARQFSSTGNINIWETGIVYRFLFPAWKGK